VDQKGKFCSHKVGRNGAQLHLIYKKSTLGVKKFQHENFWFSVELDLMSEWIDGWIVGGWFGRNKI
jgi:hypothetical protein